MSLDSRKLVLPILIVAIACIPLFLHAQSENDLRNKINEQQSEIAAIEAEIKQYEQQLVSIGREKQTLESAVRELDVSRQKVTASITLAQKQINATSAEIQELSTEIAQREKLIENNQQALSETLRRMNEAESMSLVEIILGSNDVSNLWNDIEALQRFQLVVRGEVKELASQKADLEMVRMQEEAEQRDLVAQKTELSTQQHALDINRRAKNTLLRETASTESAYQSLLAEKRKEKDAFEAQLRAYEEELQYILDPSSIPPAGKGVLSWPLANVTITQYFGNTEFARSGAYSGRGHNGIDFRASPGTPVYAALTGEVVEVNHGVAPNCQYGKWILIKHGNGLTTLYAHLSEIEVSKGQRVSTKELIGFSGNTGYATGPHLHFTVYASNAVSFKQYKCNSGPTVYVPISAYSGYLNPLDFL